MKHRDLTTKHCIESMDHEIMIGAEHSQRANKKFTFHVGMNEYRVYSNREIVDSGQAVEELLEVYNYL